MDEKHKTIVDVLLDKAMRAHDAASALHYSQAACNAANAIRGMTEIDSTRSVTLPPEPY
jgi:hypothetical protein